MNRRTGHEGLHTRVVQDKRDAETLRQVAAEIREARDARAIRSYVIESCWYGQHQERTDETHTERAYSADDALTQFRISNPGSQVTRIYPAASEATCRQA